MIPTAEELFKVYSNLYQFEEGNPKDLIDKKDFKKAIIAFAELHVQAQTEAILERLELRGETSNIIKNIVTNVYPLNEIK